MTPQGGGQILVFVAVLIALAYPLEIGVIVLTAGLMVLPALTLGPIVEGLAP